MPIVSSAGQEYVVVYTVWGMFLHKKNAGFEYVCIYRELSRAFRSNS